MERFNDPFYRSFPNFLALGRSWRNRYTLPVDNSGDIAFRFLDYIRNIHGDSSRASVKVVDINQAMLDVGKDRSLLRTSGRDDISFNQGNAESLVDLVPDESMDLYTIAFGIRNCTNIDRVLAEAFRVLKPGGRFTCLEFSRIDNDVLRM